MRHSTTVQMRKRDESARTHERCERGERGNVGGREGGREGEVREGGEERESERERRNSSRLGRDREGERERESGVEDAWPSERGERVGWCARERDLRRPVCESAATEEDEGQLHGEAQADNNGQSLRPEPAAGCRLRVRALENID